MAATDAWNRVLPSWRVWRVLEESLMREQLDTSTMHFEWFPANFYAATESTARDGPQRSFRPRGSYSRGLSEMPDNVIFLQACSQPQSGISVMTTW